MSKPSAFLQAVWDAIPTANCKGWCAESCGPIGAGPEETRLLAERGVELPDLLDVFGRMAAGGEPPSCPALVDGRCSVYEVRPTVCRLWGSVEEMPCPWGCSPADGRLPSGKGRLLMRMAGTEVGPDVAR